MELIAEISIKGTDGQKHTYTIFKVTTDHQESFEVSKVFPNPGDISNEETFSDAVNAITNDLFENEVDI